ncbi:MAG: type II toxin-antitoxin system death-on-curing family toxin [Thermoanaerobaculia bacterium]
MTVYLSLEQILQVNEGQIAAFGGTSGVRDGGGLEAAIARPQATFGGEDLYPDLAAKAAARLHSLVMNHPFLDGNKRTGAMAAELFLYANDHDLEASDDSLFELTLATARGEFSAEELAIWFRQRVRHRER